MPNRKEPRTPKSAATPADARQNLPRRPTQSDVARLAGVSAPVVSAVLTGGGGTVRVSDVVRQRVENAIETLGYAPNPIARSLVNARRNIVGVFTFDPIFPSRREDFFYPFLRGIESAVEGSGFDLLLFTAAATVGARRHLFSKGINRLALADGAVILGEDQNKDEIARLAEERFPFVIIGRREVPGVEISHVAAAYAETTSRMVDYAWDLGHRRFCYFGRGGDTESQRDRIAGFRAGLKAKDQDPTGTVQFVDTGSEWIGEAVDFIRRSDASMVFAEDIGIAEAVDLALTAAGLNIPGDISLCALAQPATRYGVERDFSRLVVPREEMGVEALQLLLRLLDNADIAPLVKTLPCRFERGATIGESS